MKLRIFILLVLFTGSASAQINKKLVRERDKLNHVATPPMGIWLYDNVFIDKTEIKNIDWLEYEFYSADSSYAYKEQLLPYMEDLNWSTGDTVPYICVQYGHIDTTWNNAFYMNESDYFRYPFFRYYPVIGITYEQAIQYCEWRSAEVTRNMNTQLAEKKSKKRVYVHYRLPTEQEWEMAALGFDTTADQQTGLKHPRVGFEKDEAKKMQLAGFPKELTHPNFNCYYPPASPGQLSVRHRYEMPDYVYEYSPNAIGLYSMIGNVSEMIDEEGVAKGGYWHLPVDSCTISSRQYYDCPNAWTGFRCIAEVYEYPVDSSVGHIAPLMARETSCEMVIRRNNKIEFDLNKNNKEYLQKRFRTLGKLYDHNGNAALWLNGKETHRDEVIIITSKDTLGWTIENIPVPEQVMVAFCRIDGGNTLYPYSNWTYRNRKSFTTKYWTHILSKDKGEDPDIFGVCIDVYYKENGQDMKDSFFRVVQCKP